MEASENMKAEAVCDSNAVMHFYVLTSPSKISFLGGMCEQWDRVLKSQWIVLIENSHFPPEGETDSPYGLGWHSPATDPVFVPTWSLV